MNKDTIRKLSEGFDRFTKADEKKAIIKEAEKNKPKKKKKKRASMGMSM